MKTTLHTRKWSAIIPDASKNQHFNTAEKFKLVLFALLVWLSCTTEHVFAQAASVTYNLTSNGNASTTGAVTGTPLAIGSGINSASYSSANGVSTNSWSNDAGGLVTNEYYEYEAVPTAGNILTTITALSFNHSVSSGTWVAAVYYSFNGFATAGTLLGANFSSTSVLTPFSASGSLAVPAGSTFSVRVYAWESDGPNRSFRMRNMAINGTTCATPTISTHPATQSICSGSALNLSVTAANATSYQWKKGGTAIGGATSSTYSIPSIATTDSGSYTVDVINSCHTVTSNTAVVTVNQTSAASITISTSATTICQGANVTFTATPVNPGTATYQWKVNGANVGTSSTSYSSTTLTNNAVVTCTMTSTTPCTTGLPAVSGGITMTVNPNLPVNVTISASATTICFGDTVTFTATPINGGPSPSYQWKVNGGNAGTDSATFAPSNLTDNSVVTCVMTSNLVAPCVTNSPDTSNAITIAVNMQPNVLTISPASSTVCPNDIVQMTATGGVIAGLALIDESFNGASTFAVGGSNSGGSIFTSRANGTNVGGATFTTPDASNFIHAYASGFFASQNSTLTSPVINTVGFTSLSLSFTHSYDKGTESGVSVQVSTDGGTNWSNITTAGAISASNTYTSSQGSSASFATANINLIAFINNANFRIRFNFAGSTGLLSNASWWAINDVALSGNGSRVTWTPITGLYTNAGATTPYVSNVITTTVYAKISNTGSFTATSTSPVGCGSTNITTTITVNPPPTLSSVTQAGNVCQDTAAIINLAGMLPSSTSTISYKIGTGSVQNIAGVIADAFGAASFNVTLSLANNGQTLTITNILRTDILPSCAFVPASNNTVTLGVNANVTYYADADSDGFGDPASTQVSCFGVPTGYVANNSDCNDAELQYLDADGDGFGSITLVACGVTNNTDCDDNLKMYSDADADGFGALPYVDCNGLINNADCNDNQLQYLDADGDGFGSTTLVACGVINNTDCNDAQIQYSDADGDGFGSDTQVACGVANSDDCNDLQLQYADLDGDGFGSTTLVGCGLTDNTDCDDTLLMYSDADADGFGALPYVNCNSLTTNSDCNDNQLQYLDSDGDGFGSTTIVACGVTNNTDCSDAQLQYSDADGDGFGSDTLVACGLANSEDCNDLQLQYADLDGDGFGSSTQVACGVTNNMDCDDTVLMYADNDGDGFGSATYVNCSGSLNNTDCDDNQLNYTDADGDSFGALPYLNCGGVNNGSDCDDSQLQYLDADNDGFGSTTVVACGVADNSDCNDSDASMHTTYSFYVDADGDTYGTGDLVPGVCAVDAQTAPAGYSSSNTDCDDSNVTIYQSGTLYVDADNDGYTSGSTALICYGATVPSGYALTNIGIDCNDSASSVHPGHSEVLYNGIDDNCDGDRDEGSHITTQIVASQCGTTLPAIGTNISAVSIQHATSYRFEVTNTSTNAVQTIVKPVQYFSLTQLASYDYATTYSIRVEVQRNGIWLGYYGTACLVSSPGVTSPNGAAQVNPSQCGITLANINTLIATTSLPGVTGYRFKVTNISDVTAPNHVQVIDRSLHWFNLPMLASYNYGTTYIIEVAVKTNGGYSPFGNACQITAPAVPTITSCGTTIATPAVHIETSSLTKVTSYRFEVTNLTTNQVTTLDRSQHWFTFNMIPGFTPSTVYGVRVAIMTAGVYSLFSDACEITSPGFARPEGPKAEAISKTAFSAIAYPNPFADNFMIHVKSSSEAQINIKAYDMTGRLLDVMNAEVPEIESQQIGANYPAGVYNIIVSQGNDVKTLRVVKR